MQKKKKNPKTKQNKTKTNNNLKTSLLEQIFLNSPFKFKIWIALLSSLAPGLDLHVLTEKRVECFCGVFKIKGKQVLSFFFSFSKKPWINNYILQGEVCILWDMDKIRYVAISSK